MDILDSYILKEPSNQNILDIFEGEWSSRLPDALGLHTEPGTALLFEDPRVVWAEEVFKGFYNMDILELGPLEGAHSYMFHNSHAKKVVSIEANSRAFLKCLCIKEIMKLNNVEFKLGDFMSFLKKENAKYDMVFASGVLYHMEEPVELLKLMSKVSDRIFLWTHYYDEKTITQNEALAHKFSPLIEMDFEGISIEYSSQAYKESLGWAGFCGGPQPNSKWLTKESIFRVLKEFGYKDIQINFDVLDHQNGPSFAICAQK